MRIAAARSAACLLILFAAAGAAEPTVGTTGLLGPFAGEGAALHPDNAAPRRIEFYGTDLGFSYQHGGRIHFLFGDSWAREAYAPIERASGSRHDDGFGSVALADWPDGDRITPGNLPAIKLGQEPNSSDMSAIDPGHAMDLGKTPEAGFSNGDREFGIFLLGKVQGCRTDAECGAGLECDTGLGYRGPSYTEQEGFTAGCIDGEPGCRDDTMTDASGAAVAGSGLCVDAGSTIWADTPAGRIAALAYKQRIAVRDTRIAKRYAPIHDWLTNKFMNTTVSTVAAFAPDAGRYDFRSAAPGDEHARLLLWGRPGFVGVAGRGRTLGLYFAYAELPAAPDFTWNIRYYTGTGEHGEPQFSPREQDARPVDLDATRPGVQAGEAHDITNQMSIVWIEQLRKWVMFYSGGMLRLPSAVFPNCGLLEAFARHDCRHVEVGNGAVRMRTADRPWGPWSPPQEVIAGGDPEVPGSGQYGAGGVLRHPACVAPGCAPHTDTPHYQEDEYGFFYCPNIVEPWITPADSGVDVIWNVSTWDPYRVVLFRTRIHP